MTRSDKIPLVDLKAQYASMKSEIDEAIARVIGNTSFILGDEVAAFEKAFAAYCAVRECIGCGNGTDALSLALEAAGVKPGDEVITVSHTFIATAEAITDIGARPVFVDVDPDTLLMDVGKIEPALSRKTKAIVPVHLYGHVVDVRPLRELAKAKGLKIVEDAAQAHGARLAGRRAGSFGDLATFSFYPGKNLGAYGDAGAIVTDDADMAAWLRKARNHGRLSKYTHEFEGRNSRMDGIQGAILKAKLAHLDDWNARRRKLASIYSEAFAGVPQIRPVVVPRDVESVFHLYVVRVPNRDAILEKLSASGIEAGVHYPVPLHRQPAYGYLKLPEGALPVTERAAGEILSLPLYPELDPATVRAVAGAVLTQVRA